ncbi:MAG: hypothetical protein NZ898_04455 [Myxococcota bacterium]|nr:hypothetical protein [Myxococcota bacterium]
MNHGFRWTWALGMLAAALQACGGDDDDVMGGTDAGVDTGAPDTGAPDTGTPDTGAPDTGMPDAGPRCPAIGERTVVEVRSDITADTTWTCRNLYRIGAQVFVGSSDPSRPATLTIEPGTVIQGTSGSNALIVTTNGRIMAQGTRELPIVFTSAQARPAPGDWGGVVLLGRAPVNYPGGSQGIEGLPSVEGRGRFGGTDPMHDCGTLRYVRIEFAGFELSMDNELNALTVGGCGSRTVLEYIQTHKGSDDGIEFFGGTADLRYALITGPGDDGLDWEGGWTGRAQFVVVQQHSGAGNSGVEADNLNMADDAMPRSEPRIWNVTLLGVRDPGEAGAGIRLRRGTAGHLHNVVVSGFTHSCVRVESMASDAAITAGTLEVRNGILHNCGPDPGTTFLAGAAARFMTGYDLRTGVDPRLRDAWNPTRPDFRPMSDSPVTMDAATPPSGGFFDMSATYLGAVAPTGTPWYEGWTAFP